MTRELTQRVEEFTKGTPVRYAATRARVEAKAALVKLGERLGG